MQDKWRSMNKRAKGVPVAPSQVTPVAATLARLRATNPAPARMPEAATRPQKASITKASRGRGEAATTKRRTSSEWSLGSVSE